jgi:GntR family transcriptional regulator, transcriptional repressor for pyruvate dehydrogenase complex
MATGALRPGDKLPAERDLAIKFGVSRTAVREALRSLEIAGVVGLQKGVKGGAFILKGDPDLVTRSIRDMFYLGQISLDDLTESRTSVMQIAIELASVRMSAENLAKLERNVEMLASLPRSATVSERLAVGSEFYHLLGQATENRAFQVIIESLTAIVLQQVEKFKIGKLPDVIAHRRRLVAFLAARRTEDAKREIAEHLRRLHKHLASEQKASAGLQRRR